MTGSCVFRLRTGSTVQRPPMPRERRVLALLDELLVREVAHDYPSLEYQHGPAGRVRTESRRTSADVIIPDVETPSPTSP